MSVQSIPSRELGRLKQPFSPLPEPHAPFLSAGHRHAVTMLDHALASGAPISLLTGDPGTGKTTAVENLLRRLPERMTIARVPATPAGPSSALAFALGALPGETDADGPPATLLARFAEVLRAEHRHGRTVLVLFDEAQALSIDALEEIRGLSNLNYGKEPVLQFVLTAQPELRHRLAHPDLHAFAQRAFDAGHLGALSGEEVTGYLRHRLRAAGGTGEELSDGAMALVARHSDGVPRLINKLCDLALAYASAAGEGCVTAATVAEVLSDSASWRARPARLEAAE